MSDIDLTDYVDVAAKAYISANTAYDWDKVGEVTRYQARELVLPVVTAVIDAYVEAHPALDLDWLEG